MAIKGEDDFKAYGNGVLKTLEQRAEAQKIKLEEEIDNIVNPL